MSLQVCPYCRVTVELSTEEVFVCEGCQTAHHADCYIENGGCTIFGCAKAPTEDPKLQVSLLEVTQTNLSPSRFLPRTSSSVIQPMPVTSGEVRVYLKADHRPNKSRVTFALLGFFLGFFGVHNFYAGYARRAVFQVSLTLFSFFYLAFVSWIWALVEICIVKTDADGLAFS